MADKSTDLLTEKFSEVNDRLSSAETRLDALERHDVDGGGSSPGNALTADENDRLRELLGRWFPHNMTEAKADDAPRVEPIQPLAAPSTKPPPNNFN